MAHIALKGLASGSIVLGTLLTGLPYGSRLPAPLRWYNTPPAAAQTQQEEATTIRVYEMASPAVVAIEGRTGVAAAALLIPVA
jgi:hypothetical protein